ncbi:DMT family transporter [Sphingomonas donggukensis]|uniref:DMT family transporter n=1 Tax=Sphingomonas donggukensis TaxID=2949093 RepID=A0ABY4TQG1_9SPHN|nr:DMT family transporter [Sphingomonas donggukensis]URW74615.1 DMT family transporter [Sphingomonas donggukensis]
MTNDTPVRPATAFAVAALGIFVFSGMDAVMKGLVLALGVYTTMFWRSLAGAILSGALYAGTRSPWPTRAAMRLHLIRGLVSVVMALSFFWGLARIPMAQAIALAFIAPILSLFLAALILKEHVPRGSVIACACAAGGVALILTGQARADLGREALAGTIAVLLSAVCYAFNIILMRAQAQVAKPIEVAFWQSLIVSTCLLIAAPWFADVPDSQHIPTILGAAVLATVSLLLLGWAYQHGEASYLAPTEYTSFVWAAILGWLVFAEPLSPWTLAGAALIVAGCFIAARGKPTAVPQLEVAP